MRNYAAGFSSNAREILEMFKFETKVKDLDNKNLLFLVTEKFAAVDLHPNMFPTWKWDMSSKNLSENLLRLQTKQQESIYAT